MVDVMFTAAKDVESAAGAEVSSEDESSRSAAATGKIKGVWQFTDSSLLQAKREAIVAAIARHQGTSLIRKSRALYWNASHTTRATITLSKRHPKTHFPYWYAYHPQWDEFLGAGERAFVVFGCMELSQAFAIPLDVIRFNLDALHVSEQEGRERYWHVYLSQGTDGEIALVLPKRKSSLKLREYALDIGTIDQQLGGITADVQQRG